MAPQKPLRLLIIGVGNPYRSDDGAGVLAARNLNEAGLDSSSVIEHSGEGASLMELWKNADAVILIDAVRSGSPAGTIHRLEPSRNPLRAEIFQSSTHAFSLPQAIEMARALDGLPQSLILFGIEGTNFQAGEELSPEVRAALPELKRRILDEVEQLRKTMGNGD